MTAICKCGQRIRMTPFGWGHPENPRANRHYATPRRVAPESEAEKRLAYGDR